jgi:LEA14-like dessication related protein
MKHIKHYVFLSAVFFSAAFLVFSGCSGAPQVAPQAQGTPRPSLVFDRLEASGPDNATAYFFMHIVNPGTERVVVKLEKSRVFVNETELLSGFDGSAETTHIDPGAEKQIKVVCNMDIKKFNPSLSLETKELDAKMVLELGFVFDGGERGSVVTGAGFSFPRIQEPRFSIVSIAIMQAELINTRFRVKVRIENPNPFPLTFSSFSYELYGHGRFWADGSESNIYTIPENGEAEEDLFLLMNFINMQRNLLDQIIAMRNVRYRFTGKAEIGTGIEYLPAFTAAFDIQGDSEVVK